MIQRRENYTNFGRKPPKRIILEWILKIDGGSMWTGLLQLRVRTGKKLLPAAVCRSNEWFPKDGNLTENPR
jgi:hypothetical protein